MTNIPSPILIFGDIYTSKNVINGSKKKFPDLQWVTKSASTDTLDSIRMEAGLQSWDEKEKVLLVSDLPNRKNVREFLIDLASSCPSYTKLLIWDSNSHIKVDPKTKEVDKTWSEFLDAFKNIPNNKIVNSGEEFTEKKESDIGDIVNYIVDCFAKHKKQIGYNEAKLLISIVGHDRGMLHSDIQKLLIMCPDKVSAQYIIDNAFPSTKEAILYKLGNSLDEDSFENAINMMDRFLEYDINPNQIAEMFLKKARWQMVTTSLWASGLPWESIPDKLFEMGRFPSQIWHNEDIGSSQKKSESEMLQTVDNMREYMVRQQGIPIRYLKPVKKEGVTKTGKKSKAKVKTSITRKGSESIPMYFMASQIVDFVRNKIYRTNSKIPLPELKTKMMNRAIKVYSFTMDKSASIRYGDNPMQDLQEMIKLLMSYNVESFS
jgi:hypothetical protein